MKLLFATIALVLSQVLCAQTLYWIGGSGNWTDPTHWSNSSGGATCSCVPTLNDNVEFNTQSGSGPSVTINAQAYCKDMTWTTGLSSPSIAGSAALDIYGSMTLTSGMGITYTGAIRFKSTIASLRTITTAGNQLRSSITFDGAGAQWVLQDSFVTYNTGSSLTLTQGSLNTNGQYVYLSRLNSAGNVARALTLGNSEIDLTYTGTGTTVAWDLTSTNMNFSGGTSHITLTGSSSRFTGGNLPYYDVEFQNTSSAYLDGTNTFHDVSFTGNANIISSNTFHDLSFGVSKTYTLGSTSTQAILGDFIANGTSGSPTIINGSGTCTTKISKATGAVCINYCTLTNVCAIGGASFGTQNCILNSSTGWLPNSCPGLSCTASLAPTSIAASASSGGYSVYLNIPASCSWTVNGVPTWLTWTSALSGVGSATLSFTVQTNPDPGPRSATITIGGEALFVSQAAPGCSYTLTPMSNLSVPAAGPTNHTIAVSTQSGCGWTASSNAPWISITAGFAGFGNGTVYYTVTNHTGSSPRSGSITVAGQTFQVTQLGTGPSATYTVSAYCQPGIGTIPITALSTSPLKICADGSTATKIVVTASGAPVVLANIQVRLAGATADDGYSGAFDQGYSPIGSTTTTYFRHPSYLESGPTPYRTDVLEVFNVNDQATVLATVPVRIYRAPVLFVHGFIGDQGTFASMTSTLVGVGCYPSSSWLTSGSPLLFRVNYKSRSMLHLSSNKKVVPSGINNLLNQSIAYGYSCGKAIVVAHSMGGLLSRLYLQSSWTGVNYRGDIHKLVTLNTPHYGTQFANYSMDNVTVVLVPFLSLMNVGTVPGYGAVQDMCVDSDPILYYVNVPQSGNALVPSVTISTDEVGDVGGLFSQVNMVRAIYSYALGTGNVYDSEVHDVVVPLSSQQSGITLQSTVPAQWHIGSSGNATVKTRVLNLIDDDPTGGSFTNSGFVPGSLTYLMPPSGSSSQVAYEVERSTGDTVYINAPLPGAPFAQGSTVTVDIGYDGNIDHMLLAVSGGGITPITIDTTEVPSLDFQVPPDAVGTLQIYLFGGDSTGWLSVANTHITIASPVPPDSLSCDPSEVTLPLGLTQAFSVYGFFAGGPAVDLTGSPDLAMTFDSDYLQDIGAGVLQAIDTGTTMVVFDYMGTTDTSYVTIVNDSTALVAAFDYSTNTLCAGQSVSYFDQSEGLVQSYAWSFPGGLPPSSSQPNPVVIYPAAGTYPVTLVTTFENGTDSLYLDDLIAVTAGPVASISDLGSSLYAEPAGASYQWMDCDNDSLPIVDATDQEYVPTTNGNYSVVVTEGVCSDTSSCYFYGSTGLGETSAHNGIAVRPNPTHGTCIVQLPALSRSVRIEVTDVADRLLLFQSHSDVQQVQIQLDAPSGVYLLNVYVGDIKTTFKLVKN